MVDALSPRASLIIILTILTLTPTINAVQIDLSGQVSTVQDGYTFILKSGQTIRLADIEIPGIYQRGYEQAKDTLTNLVAGKTVYLTRSSLYGVIDGRLICVAYVDYDSQNYLNLNKKMIDSGFATIYDTRNDFLPNTWTLLVPKDTPPPLVTHTLTIKPPNGSGSTDPPTGAYLYNQLVTVPVQAIPSSGWEFDHWILDDSNVGSQNPNTVYMDADHQLVAVFNQNPPSPTPPTTYTLVIQSPDGVGSTFPVLGSYNYPQATSVHIEAIPQSGWQFDHWILDGVNVGNMNPISVDMNRDRIIKVVFTKIPTTTNTLSIQNPIGSGSTNPPTGSYTYQNPVGVAVKATPSAGWIFDHWVLDDANVGSVNPYEVAMTSNHQLTAVFIQSQSNPPPQTGFNLVVQPPEGSGSTDPPSGSYTYQQPVRTTLRAKPAPGWSFDHWILDGANAGKSNPTEVVMNANHLIKAVFVADEANQSGGIPGYPLESALTGILLYLTLISLKSRFIKPNSKAF